MDILDICSWVPANELSLERIEKLVLSLNSGKPDEEGYSLEMKLPINANENVISCSNDFIGEGRRICYLLMNNAVMQLLLGYPEKQEPENHNLKVTKMFGGAYLKNAFKKISLAILGLLQGTFGSYLALLGWAFAFPEASPGTKDYEEDMLFVPFGYMIMFVWLVIMITAIIVLKKNKKNLLLFIIPWCMGLVGCLVGVFVIL